MSTRAVWKRDDSLRFVQDKRIAYASLLAACDEVADAEHDSRLIAANNATLERAADVANEDIDEHNRRYEANEARRLAAYKAGSDAIAIVQLIAPPEVVAAADVFLSRSHHPHFLPRRVRAQTEFVERARTDLGYPSTAHLRQTVPYEKYIPFDHSESGIDV